MQRMFAEFGGPWQWGERRLRRFVEKCHECRSCQDRVGLMDDVCPTCGASNPSVIPISPSMVVTACGAAALLILLWTT